MRHGGRCIGGGVPLPSQTEGATGMTRRVSKLLVKNSSHPLYTYNFYVRHCMYATAYWCKTYLGFDGLMQDNYLKFTNPNDPNDEGYKNYTCWKLFADKCKFLIYDMIKMS